MKRKGWIRIGIVATVLWIGVGAFWGYSVADLERTRTVVYWTFDCASQNGANYDQCAQESNKLWPAANRKAWATTGVYALGPVFLGWIVAYGVFTMVCWIRAGF